MSTQNISQIIDGIHKNKINEASVTQSSNTEVDIKKVKKSFDKIKLKETWEDIKSISKDDFSIPTKYVSIDTGIIGKKDMDTIDPSLLEEFEITLKKKMQRSVSEIEVLLKRFLKDAYRVIEISNMRVIFQSKKNKRHVIEIRYNKKLKKSIDAKTSEVQSELVEPEEVVSEVTLEKKARDLFKQDLNEVPKAEELVRKFTSNTYKDITPEKINIDSIMKESGCTKEVADKVSGIAKSIFEESLKKEPQITKDLVNIVKSLGGSMYGLDFRLKQGTSLGRKIATDAKEFGGNIAKAANNIKDNIRYTALFSTNKFTNSYRKVKKELEDKGYIELRCKNFYLRYTQGNSQQKSIQCVYKSPSGVVFELQFHTPESQVIKEVNHPMYEKFRDSSLSGEDRGVLNYRMINMSNEVPDPQDVLSIEEHG